MKFDNDLLIAVVDKKYAPTITELEHELNSTNSTIYCNQKMYERLPTLVN